MTRDKKNTFSKSVSEQNLDLIFLVPPILAWILEMKEITCPRIRRDLYQPNLIGSIRRSTPILPGIGGKGGGGGTELWIAPRFTPTPKPGNYISGVKGSGGGDASLKYSSTSSSIHSNFLICAGFNVWRMTWDSYKKNTFSKSVSEQNLDLIFLAPPILAWI